jgi:SpoVK/Ycf46/Vps4 family AAA+-type ATPase
MTKINESIESDFLKLARIALSGRPQDIQLLIHKVSKRYKGEFPQLSKELITLLQESPTRSSPLRKQHDIPLPVDVDSRLQLLRVEGAALDHDLVLSESLYNSIEQVLAERRNVIALNNLGLHPTKSILLTGPPGVGKTMAAKWIAEKINRPLLILDLSAVMSSYLGRTGNNIRFVLDYAKSIECVLLLDELDAIAKRRDDQSEVGELKRLVTVLLQEIDDWPATGLLIAATNHPDLLDPAVWRRFEMVLNFNNPSAEQIKQFLIKLLEPHLKDFDRWSDILSHVYLGKSFSDIEKLILNLRKRSVMSGASLQELLETEIKSQHISSSDQKMRIAKALTDMGMSQRKINEVTGIARETIRKAIPVKNKKV